MKNPLFLLLLGLFVSVGCAHRYETLQALSGEYDLLELDDAAADLDSVKPYISVSSASARFPIDSESG